MRSYRFLYLLSGRREHSPVVRQHYPSDSSKCNKLLVAKKNTNVLWFSFIAVSQVSTETNDSSNTRDFTVNPRKPSKSEQVLGHALSSRAEGKRACLIPI